MTTREMLSGLAKGAFVVYAGTVIISFPCFIHSEISKYGFWTAMGDGGFSAGRKSMAWPYHALKAVGQKRVVESRAYAKRISQVIKEGSSDQTFEMIALNEQARNSENPTPLLLVYLNKIDGKLTARLSGMRCDPPPDHCQKVHDLVIARLEWERQGVNEAVKEFSLGLFNGLGYMQKLKEKTKSYNSRWEQDFSAAWKEAGLPISFE